MTSLSVAMTTFNGEAFLRKQLNSLAAQQRQPSELVVVDDGSTDGTMQIVESFAQTASFPVAIHQNQTRLGWRANFIRAASLCRHDLIAFCDQDDFWYDTKLASVQALFSDPETLLVHHNVDLVDADGVSLGLLDSPGAFAAIQNRLERPTSWANPLGLTMTFRRTLLDFVPFWPLSVDPTTLVTPAAHDQFFYRLATNLGRVRYIAAPLLAYRQHGGNAVGFTHDRPRISGDKRLTWRSVQPELQMLEGFCRVLAEARRSSSSALTEELHEALAKNTVYRERLTLAELAHTDGTLLGRARHCLTLVCANVFRSGATWSLGYRAILAACALGVPFRR